MKVGYCAVTADILHEGHIRYINACKKLCDFLMVGVMTDQYIKEYKGREAIFTQQERMFMVENLKSVDMVVSQDSYDDPATTQFDILFDCEEHERWNELPGTIIFPRFSKHSSTEIIERVKKNENIDNS